MSAFQPINVAAGQDQKRQLLAKLMDQYQQNAGRAAALSGAVPAVAGVASLAHGRGPLGTGLVTGTLPNFGLALASLLGPGGVGHPIAGRESSIGSGLPVTMPFVANPHAYGSPARTVAPPAVAPVASAVAPTAPTPVAPTAPPTTTGDPSASTAGVSPVSLGNNLYYNASTGQVVTGAAPIARPGTGFFV